MLKGGEEVLLDVVENSGHGGVPSSMLCAFRRRAEDVPRDYPRKERLRLGWLSAEIASEHGSAAKRLKGHNHHIAAVARFTATCYNEDRVTDRQVDADRLNAIPRADMQKFSLKDWMATTKPEPAAVEVLVLQERAGSRSTIDAALQETVRDHFVGLEVISRMGGYKKTLAFIRNKLPQDKRVRSGDFGEILASEYVDQCMEFRVPIKRLRWKDDRNATMRGNDVIAIRKRGNKWCLLKAESKSRAALSDSVVEEAVEGLEKHSGRPNPSTLAFISSRLRELRRDDEAIVFENLQSRSPKPDEIEHLVFTLSGNNPAGHLTKHRKTAGGEIRRHLVGCVIVDHQQFIKSTFDAIYAGNKRGNRQTP